MLMRDAVAERSGKSDHLVLFTVHRLRTVHGPSPFRLLQNATATARIEPATFGQQPSTVATVPPRRTLLQEHVIEQII